MTPEAAARQYLADHMAEWAGKGYTVYNPHNKPLAELPVIYGFNNGGPNDWLEAVAIAADGNVLGSHICSHELYMLHDLGVTEGARPDRHEEHYRKHYPDGYVMDFVSFDRISSHKGLALAFELNKRLEEQYEKEQP